jgi:hypothetical protein
MVKPIVFLFLLSLSVINMDAQKSNTKNIPTSDSPYKIFPADQSKQDESLLKFLDQLKRTIARKDTAAFSAILDTGVEE